MCKFKSGIILKDRVFIPDYDSHARMLEELKIRDEQFTPNFVKVEFAPPFGLNIDYSDYSKWIFRVDQDVLPEWYVEEVDRKRFIEEFSKWAKDNIVINKEITKDSKNYKAYINCTGIIYNNPNINLVYGGEFSEIEKCEITVLIKTAHIENLISCSIDNINNNKIIENAIFCHVVNSCSNQYLNITNSYIDYSESDKIHSSRRNYFNYTEESTDILNACGGIIRYFYFDKPKKVKSKCNTIIINYNKQNQSYLFDTEDSN